MLKIKSTNLVRDVLLFGLTALLFLVADFFMAIGGELTAYAVDVLLAGILALNAAIFCSLLANIRRDIALLVFTAAYNLLLLGRVYVSWIGYRHKMLMLLEADGFPQMFLALQLIAASLVCVFVAYHLAAPLFARREAQIERGEVRQSSALLPILRQLAFVALLVSSIPFFYKLGTVALSVLRNGYLNSFTVTGEIPAVISRLSMFFIPAFAVYLATLPSLRQMRLPLAVYGVYMVSSLLTGRRNTLVTELLMLLVYFVMRDSMLPKGKQIISKKLVISGGVLAVVGAYLLQLMALVRTNAQNLLRNPLDMIVSFIDSQGASFRVVVQTVNHWALFDRDTAWQYLLHPFELFVHNNIISRNLFGLEPIVEVQNSLYVQGAHNFAHAITYAVQPERYLSGGGFGTSYVAEGYVAFGVLGLVALSLFFGLAFRFFSSMVTRNWVLLASGLLAIKDFVYLPRSFAFMWVTNVFNITYFCFYLGLFLAALLLLRLGTHLRPERFARQIGEGSV